MNRNETIVVITFPLLHDSAVIQNSGYEVFIMLNSFPDFRAVLMNA